jgi:aspartate-semialdehyde dehydrogenase
MQKKTVGIVGWRGMVGSVLIQRMKEEDDFSHFDAVFFSTSQAGSKAPLESCEALLWDANDISSLKKMDIILTCQGGSYTEAVHSQLRGQGWGGLWIDAASTLRMNSDSILVLDPLNKESILAGLSSGQKDFVGANCTVSLMLLALSEAFKSDLVDWISVMTYQAASGAGAKNMKELLLQMEYLGSKASSLAHNPNSDILEMDNMINGLLQKEDSEYPKELFGAPLAGSLIPWIDSPVSGGQTREEWKAMVEGNKILGLSGDSQIQIDGTCVRIGAMRSHSQALTIKLKKSIEESSFVELLRHSHEWLDYVPNEREATVQKLNPAHYSGSLKISLGRVRKMNLGDSFFNAFTVGDQLLWGAAEPLRRFLRLALLEG